MNPLERQHLLCQLRHHKKHGQGHIVHLQIASHIESYMPILFDFRQHIQRISSAEYFPILSPISVCLWERRLNRYINSVGPQ